MSYQGSELPTNLHVHGGYVPHSHEVRADHLGVPAADTGRADQIMGRDFEQMRRERDRLAHECDLLRGELEKVKKIPRDRRVHGCGAICEGHCVTTTIRLTHRHACGAAGMGDRCKST